MGKVTFIMPAFNAENYICEAIDSILAQTVSDWKLIVINDCSTDSTLSLAESYAKKDGRIKVISTTVPSGSAYEPRKKGILEADTKYVAPLDADDFIGKDYLEKLLYKIEETGSVAAYPTMISYREGTTKYLLPKDTSLFENPQKGRDCVALTLNGWKINCNGGVIEKNSYLEAFTQFRYKPDSIYADEVLTRQLLLIYPQVAFSDAEYFYRHNSASVTNKKSLTQFDFLKSNLSLLKITEKNYGSDSLEYQLAQVQNFLGYFDALEKLNKFSSCKNEEKFNSKEISIINKTLKEVRKAVSLDIIKNKVSMKRKLLFKAGTPLTRFALQIKDKFSI